MRPPVQGWRLIQLYLSQLRGIAIPTLEHCTLPLSFKKIIRQSRLTSTPDSTICRRLLAAPPATQVVAARDHDIGGLRVFTLAQGVPGGSAALKGCLTSPAEQLSLCRLQLCEKLFSGCFIGLKFLK